MADMLAASVNRVVDNDLCSGCGVCSLISARISVAPDGPKGFMRPTVAGAPTTEDKSEALTFLKVCPGSEITAPAPAEHHHEVFGRYVSVWQGWAADPELREAGSSGGVITALNMWLISSGQVQDVVCSAADKSTPSRTVPVTITNRAEALEASGSRYAPVANGAAYRGTADSVFVGKPCEVSAVSQLETATGADIQDIPFKISFFCAGTPSQEATDRLVSKLGVSPRDVDKLRYRGNGWPGEFTVSDTVGASGSMSYEDSWGRNLGRDVQWRCRPCIDGTGGHADIAVGDYWAADDKGFPVFENSDGNSVVIARTARGHESLMRAANHGVIWLDQLDLNSLTSVQPLQAVRRRGMLGRLIGSVIAGGRVPRYIGYQMALSAIRHPVLFVRQVVGTARRLTQRKGANPE
ncbi:MAG: Coenzyme F420 hydrogenase/dehydrogenase, beta subunit C-terminal domain [Aeromicrobium sp.]|uniref:Coenzyme F420 hydrogenase/dehydrogenase, beta subunit C-terminal domain n=1 Tax=Aeromicrobium sp. TaxID=1871063 RepID=UPI0026273736|nr:Coenzyme F420 hydrogenase/dehydrogenase, beta subunit C-terminal domain [Aeromicrobium sp.]MDF1706235.1 Coenzyme F420 hydrogenase/dehydrogenase, beta subunit C-terminal domain [Aeromicrobium sp.]